MGSYTDLSPNFESSILTSANRPLEHLECFIPAATPQCHASNLLKLANGDLLCAWFGGSQEGKPDISIYLSRLQVGVKSWTEAEKVTFDGSRSEQNPILFQAESGEVWLLYTSQHAGDQDSAIVKRQISADDGKQWGAPEVLFSEPGTFIRQPVVLLESGALVIPIFKCRVEPGVRWVGNDDISAVRVSQDNGKHWNEKEVPNSFGAVHMAIRQLQDKTYLALYRSRWADNIYSSTSPNGIDWTEPAPTSLPNPNSGICFDVLPSGRILTVYNHSSKADAQGRREGLYDDIAEAGDDRKNQVSKHADREAFWGAPRAPLCLAWSDDAGNTWQHKVLESGDGYCMTNNSENKLNRELSYPSMSVDADGMVHIAFTFWRQKIKYVRLDPSVLDQQ
jgi:predicted neuraminidase